MRVLSKLVAISMIVVLSAVGAFAVDAKKVHKKRITPQGLYLKAKEAYPFIKKHQKELLFVDIRTRGEFEYVGSSALVDKNIPYHFKDLSKWNSKKHRYSDSPLNANFVNDVAAALKAKGLNKDSKIALICRSGSRSTKAANLLWGAGYKNVYNIIDGFEGGKSKKTKHRTANGWKNAGNPWTYTFSKEQAYLK